MKHATAAAIDTTPTHSYGPDYAKVTGYAEFAVFTLRANGVSDADILTTYAVTDADADASFEAGQLRDSGFIHAPAALVKSEMARIIRAGK